MVLQIEQFRKGIISLEGWPRRFTALLLGGLIVLALPPFYFWIFLVPGFVGLAWLIDGSQASKKRRYLRFTEWPSWSAFSVGWWFGVGFFAAGLYWVSFAFLVEEEKYAWMIPFVLFCLSAGMALYTGLTSLATYLTSSGVARRVLNLALWWVIFEWIRGWAFTGFPWNLLGTVWTNSESMIQVTAVTGIFGLSLVTVLAAASPAVLGEDRIPLFKRWVLIFITWAVLVLVWAGGYIRLNGATEANVEGVQLRLVQPNIAQRDKWKLQFRRHHFDKLLRLSSLRNQITTLAPTHIIWPETATPFFFNSDLKALGAISAIVPIDGALITGAPRQTRTPNGAKEIWNSIHIIDSFARIRDTYDKYHLVPIGEYVPFRGYFSFSSLTGGRIDFSPGPGPKTLAVPNAPPVIPLICYEAIFPHNLKYQGSHSTPGWLLNLTNDAWFGLSSGPYQHFAAAQLRSVEVGLPLVRVANTGLSGVIDSYGRVRIRTNLNQEIAVESPLPKPFPGITWFVKYGNTTVFVLCFLLFWISRLEYFSFKE